MEELKHYGVKGMRWGVHKAKSRVNQTIKSMKREKSWRKELKNMNYMSTDELNRKARQIGLENEMKRLSYTKGVGNKEDRKNYRLRSDMTHEEITQVVNRLRAKSNFHRTVNEASRSQQEMGRRMTAIAATVGIKYATGQSIRTRDVVKAYTAPKKSKFEALKETPQGKAFMDKELVKERKKRKDS